MAKQTNRFKLKYNPEGLQRLLVLPSVTGDLEKRAERVAAEASEGGRVEGYLVTPLVLEESRAAVSVMATGYARSHNNKHHALLRALDAGR